MGWGWGADGGNTWLQGLMTEFPDSQLVSVFVLFVGGLLQPLKGRLLSQQGQRHVEQSVEEVDRRHHGHEEEPKPESRRMS